MIKVFSLFLIAFFCIYTFSINAQVTARAAIDFGSGAIKIQVFLIDQKFADKIGEPIYAHYVPVNLTEDVANYGQISPEMEQRLVNILQEFKEKTYDAAENYPVEFSGIATEVFRRAKNGGDFLAKLEKNLGIPFRILTQEEEARLGHITSKALHPEIPEESLIAWDSGNGSFQMTSRENGNYQFYPGPLGHGTVRIFLSHQLRNSSILQGHQSGNPVTEQEFSELKKLITATLPPIPEWLQEKLASKETVICTHGDGESAFALVAQAASTLEGKTETIQQAVINSDNIKKVLQTFLDKEDSFLKDLGVHHKTVTSTILLATVMEHFQINSFLYKKTIGNTAGLAIAPESWTPVAVKTDQEFKEIPSIAFSAVDYLNNAKTIKNTTRFIFVRHGESTSNKEKGIAGRTHNVDLSLEGIEQAKLANEQLSQVKIDALFSSPMLRTMHTAELVCPSLEAQLDERLHEKWYGPYEGASESEYAPLKKKEEVEIPLLTCFEEKFNYKPHPEIESLQEIYKRINGFMFEVIESHSEENVLILTHNGIMKSLFMSDSHKKGFDVEYRDFDLGNCSIVVVEMGQDRIPKVVACTGLKFRKKK